MMTILLLGLELYLAAMLWVSGLAKLEHPDRFADTLRRHSILPAQAVPAVSRMVPALEVILACSLILGTASAVTAALVLLLFAGFLVIEITLVATKRATDCGCYGVAYPIKVDLASIADSAVLTLLAGLHLWLVRGFDSVGLEWRWLPVVLGGGAGGWLTWRVLARRRLG